MKALVNMRHVIATLSGLLVALLVRTSAAQSFVPVPADLLQGTMLTDRERNFSLRAPEEGWTWYRASTPEGRVYGCRHEADGLSFIVLVQDDGRRVMSAHSADRFAAGVVDSLMQQRFQRAPVVRADSDRLFSGSHRLRAQLVGPDGQPRRFVGYVGVKDKLYGIQAVVPDDAAEQRFEAFAASFRLLEPVPTYPMPSVVFGLIVLVLAVVGWWLVFVRLRWSSIYERARWPLAILSPLGLVLPAAYVWAVCQGTKTPDELDYVLGQTAGVLLVVVVFALVRSVVERRSRAA